MIDANNLISDFLRAAELAGLDIKQRDIHIDNLPAPHIPPSTLPSGKMAVYVFHWGDRCLKVGKVGPKSSNSNLAKSILKDKAVMGINEIDEHTVGNWVKQNTGRVNFLIPESFGIPLLSLLEAFLQCRLKPCFEGFDTQK